jgi:hypothetical protein
VKVTAAVPALLHTDWSAGAVTVGVGSTVIVKFEAAPVQPLADGVTIITAVSGVLPPLVAVKEAMLPLPVAGRPMEAMSLAQLKVAPLTAPVNVTAAVVAVLHNVWSGVVATFGVGFTVTVTICGVPAQLLADGITFIVAITGAALPLTAVKDAILPVPEAARPMPGRLFVQV